MILRHALVLALALALFATHSARALEPLDGFKAPRTGRVWSHGSTSAVRGPAANFAACQSILGPTVNSDAGLQFRIVAGPAARPWRQAGTVDILDPRLCECIVTLLRDNMHVAQLDIELTPALARVAAQEPDGWYAVRALVRQRGRLLDKLRVDVRLGAEDAAASNLALDQFQQMLEQGGGRPSYALDIRLPACADADFDASVSKIVERLGMLKELSELRIGALEDDHAAAELDEPAAMDAALRRVRFLNLFASCATHLHVVAIGETFDSRGLGAVANELFSAMKPAHVRLFEALRVPATVTAARALHESLTLRGTACPVALRLRLALSRDGEMEGLIALLNVLERAIGVGRVSQLRLAWHPSVAAVNDLPRARASDAINAFISRIRRSGGLGAVSSTCDGGARFGAPCHGSVSCG